MPEIRFRSDSSVELVECMASDVMVCNAARISTGSYDQDAYDHVRKAGLVNYLMKNRHGTPFEHNAFTFRIECPIFVAREFMRHRIASYNEESARYKQLEGVFWVPAPARPLVQEGKPGHYTMKPGSKYQYDYAVDSLQQAASFCYARYEDMLQAGIAREVARAALTVAVYTSFYVTMNARGLMNFLSLRVDDPDAAYPSKPQYEIEGAALQMEDFFARAMPVTYDAFKRNGRVAP
jgi:thymidylate synthase (FAD)